MSDMIPLPSQPVAPRPSPSAATGSDSAAARILGKLLDSFLVLPEEWDDLPPADKTRVLGARSKDELLTQLVDRRLLTRFQADTIRAGKADGLLVGSYRIREKLGHGGMGVVYLAEHVHLRRPVAIKMTAEIVERHPRLVHRFYAEARSVARLQHPNIVACLDAGRHQPKKPGKPPSDYFVMEYVPGQDLDAVVRATGPLPVHRAADVFKQVADALAEAHKCGLVHRDLKPSNVLVTPDWQAKLLDFGLARHPRMAMTEPGAVLGTVGFMAPEQARNPHAVDGRADLFALGATLFWALTGREPYPETGNQLADLTRRMTAPPPCVRTVRPELPAEVADLVAQLMEVDPDRRYPSAAAVSTALTPFTRWVPVSSRDTDQDGEPVTRVLVIDPDEAARATVAGLLDGEYRVTEAATGAAAMAELERHRFDLVVLDATPPDRTAQELIAAARRPQTDRPVMILVASGTLPVAALGGLVSAGADDFLTKPFCPTELRSRARALLGRRDAPPARDTAADTHRVGFADLLRTPAPPPDAGASGWELMTVTVANLLTEAGYLAPGFRSRLPRYVRAMAQRVEPSGEYLRLKDPTYLNLLAGSAVLFDIGMMVLPGGGALKPGKLDEDEKQVIETHPTVGADVLASLADRFPSEAGAVAMAVELARGHHERWDGTGYPDRLAGAAVPLSARVVAIATVYDSLRSRRPYRPAVSHSRAVRILTAESEGRFDPVLSAAFAAAADRCEQVFTDYPT